MQRQKKQQQKMLKELQSGERVITNGGIVGTIVKLDEETMVIRVKPDNMKIEVTRSAVASKIGEQARASRTSQAKLS